MISISTNVDSNRITIFFCIPGRFVKTIKINKYSKVRSLTENDDQYKYIFNGCIINPDSIFQDIGISNGNVLIAFKNCKGHENYKYDQCIKLSKDSSFEFKLRFLANKRTKNEYFRLRDIRNLKIEGNSKLYRKMERKLYNKRIQEASNQIDFDFEINYEPSPMPCTEAMPILW